MNQHFNQNFNGIEADWDHNIYSFNTSKNSGNKDKYEEQTRMQKNKVPFDFGNIYSFNKMEIHGNYENKDLRFEIII